MKIAIYLSTLLMSSALGGVAQAAEVATSKSVNASESTWSEKADTPPQQAFPAAVKVSEVEIFPGLAVAPSAHSPGLSDAGAARALMAPAGVLASNKDFGVNSFLAYLNLPQASYAFPGQNGSAGALRAKTKLTGKVEAAKSIAEPASEVLMLAALAALAIAVRRKMPDERF